MGGAVRKQVTPGFFDYLKNKDVDFIPTAKLRWWLPDRRRAPAQT